MEQHNVKYRKPVRAVGFAQIEHVITLDDRISDGAYRLYCLYIMYAQQKDSCFPGRERLARQFKCSESTISRRNKELEDSGYITRQKRLGTSSMTYLEEVQDIPYLQDIAKLQLSNRVKNDTSMVSNTTPQSSQKCYVNKNKIKEQDKELRPMDAESSDSDSNESTLDSRGVFVQEFVDNEYFEFECYCGFTLDARRLKKTRLKCPDCGVPIEIRDSHGVVTHKPFIPKKRQRVLGDIIPDCPTKLQDIMYYAKQEKQIKLLLAQNKEILFDALNWAVNKFIKGEMAESVIVASALTWAGKRHETSQKEQPQKGTPLPQYKPVIPEWLQ